MLATLYNIHTTYIYMHHLDVMQVTVVFFNHQQISQEGTYFALKRSRFTGDVNMASPELAPAGAENRSGGVEGNAEAWRV